MLIKMNPELVDEYTINVDMIKEKADKKCENEDIYMNTIRTYTYYIFIHEIYMYIHITCLRHTLMALATICK